MTFRIGVTFHSFTAEYVSFVYSFEDLMELASCLGGGVEIVGPAHHRGFPEVTDEFERVFKSAMERYGLTPTCYGSYQDPFMLPERDLTPDEMYEYTVPQLKGAAKLGFPVVRLQYYAYPIAERLVPLAEKLGLRLGYELHSPLMIESPTVQKLIEQIDTLGSDRLGLIPDCGIFARSVSDHHLAMGRQMGIPELILAEVERLWKAKTPVEKALERIQELGGNQAACSWTEMVWGSFGYSEPSALADVKDYIVHVHGKFYSIVDGEEPDLRYEEVVKTLIDIGYAGWLSSEYEGPPTDSFEIVRQHQEMIRQYIAKFTR